MFDNKKYYDYIQILEITKNAIHIILIAIGFLIGSFNGILGILIGMSTGFVLASLYTFKVKIQIQKMKWDVDIHDMIKSIKDNKI